MIAKQAMMIAAAAGALVFVSAGPPATEGGAAVTECADTNGVHLVAPNGTQVSSCGTDGHADGRAFVINCLEEGFDVPGTVVFTPSGDRKDSCQRNVPS